MITLQELISTKETRINKLQTLLEDEDRVSEINKMEKEIQSLREELELLNNIKESTEN